MDGLLKEISDELREKFGENIEKIIVFGSYARGDYREQSDIDILVVVSNSASNDIESDIRRVIYSYIPKAGRLISVKVINSRIYYHMKNTNCSFIRSVEKDGIALG